MKSFWRGVRCKLSDALSGRTGALAWRAARLVPALRAAGDFKRGQIHAPLATLMGSRLRLPEVPRLRERLADMAAFCRAEDRAITSANAAASPPPARAAFNTRVLFALHSCGAFDPTGYASRSVALIRALQGKGIAPAIATRPGYPWDLPQHANAPKSDTVEYRGLQFRLTADPQVGIRDPESRYVEAYARRLEALATAHQASVIHAASNYLNGAAAAAAARSLGITSVYEVRGLWHLTRAFAEPGYAGSDHFRYCELRELRACADVDHVITLSAGLRQWLIERGIAAGRVSIVGNAANLPALDADAGASDRRELRSRHGIPLEAKVIGYLGAIVEYEGLDALIRAHARTPSASRPYLLFVGSGAYEAVLRADVQRLGTASRVVFAGRVSPDRVSAYYAAIDAAVLPRRDDILTRLVPAIKPFEVLAHRRPLFVSSALAQALGDTLPSGYRVLDVDSMDRLDSVFDDLPVGHGLVEVPTWDDRAASVLALYRRITAAGMLLADAPAAGLE